MKPTTRVPAKTKIPVSCLAEVSIGLMDKIFGGQSGNFHRFSNSPPKFFFNRNSYLSMAIRRQARQRRLFRISRMWTPRQRDWPKVLNLGQQRVDALEEQIRLFWWDGRAHLVHAKRLLRKIGFPHRRGQQGHPGFIDVVGIQSPPGPADGE